MTDEILLDDVMPLFHDEDLIRFRRRAEKRDLERVADAFSAEIDLRKERERKCKKRE